MKPFSKKASCALALALLGAANSTSAQSLASRSAEMAKMTLPADLPPVPRVKAPIYLMEYHIWYDSPFGTMGRRGYFHGGPSDLADTQTMGPDWMRSRANVGYPLPGPYNSEDPGIIRWQLRCMKNAGIDGVFVQLFPEWNTALEFHEEPVFKNLLDIAAEEGVKVGIHDEVAFRYGSPAQNADVLAQRAGNYIKKYGKHPAFLRIEGKPAYAFQYWNLFGNRLPVDQLPAVLKQGNQVAGEEIYWMPFRYPEAKLLSIPEVGGIVGTSNSNTQLRTVLLAEELRTPTGRFSQHLGRPSEPVPPALSETAIADFRRIHQQFPDKELGMWGYPGFNDSTIKQPNATWLPRQGGRTLIEALRAFDEQSPGFIMLSSWNDWEENTALEPGLLYDDYNGDPYLYCRILAASKGKTFVPPPLPPRESVDPLMWQPLYGIDKTPPQIADWRYLPLDPAIIATTVDSGSAVTRAALATHGDAWLDLPRLKAALTPSSNGATLEASAPALSAEGTIVLPPGKPVRITLDSKALAGTREDLFIALEFLDGGTGWLEVRYPADPPRVDYKPSDEKKVPVRAMIALQNSGKWRSEVRLMRGFDLTLQPSTLLVTYLPPVPPKVEGQTPPAPGPVQLARVHVFQDMAGATQGREVSLTDAKSQVKTWRFTTPNLKESIPRSVFLITEDASGNRSVPFAISGADHEGIKNHR